MDEHGGDEVCVCETLTDELAVARARLADLEAKLRWEPDRWWRVVYADQRRTKDGRLQVWCESSDQAEVTAAVGTCPGGGILQRYWKQRPAGEWRPALDAASD